MNMQKNMCSMYEAIPLFTMTKRTCNLCSFIFTTRYERQYVLSKTFHQLWKWFADIKSTDSSPSTHVTSEEVAQQLRAVTDPLPEQLELLCNLMKDLPQSSLRRSEKSRGLAQGSSMAPTPSFKSSNENINSCMQTFLWLETKVFAHELNHYVAYFLHIHY